MLQLYILLTLATVFYISRRTDENVFASAIQKGEKQKTEVLLLTFYLSFLVWANHGDDISTQYTGTPALKGDFVRYFFFPMAIICIQRLLLSNFLDLMHVLGCHSYR